MDSNCIFKKIVIVGVGLIGGSLGLAVNRKSLAGRVVGIGRSRESLEPALKCGAVHSVSLGYEAAAGADLIVLAVPVGLTLKILSDIAPYISPGAIITDVGSTKSEIVSGAGDLIPEGTVFIGGHPMAGSEKGGISCADAYLFENAFYVLTPVPGTENAPINKLLALVRGIGANPVLLGPEDHDLSVAAVSHMPHLMAATLVNSLFDMPGSEKMSLLAAGGFRDTTRIAASGPEMWRDIFMSNSKYIIKTIEAFRIRLDEFEAAVKNRDGQAIYDLLSRARTLKSGMPAKKKGYLPALWEITVTVPDKPGVIAELAGILGRAGINICDIEILRIREGEGGTIRVGFASEEEQEKSVPLLIKSGIPTIKRN